MKLAVDDVRVDDRDQRHADRDHHCERDAALRRQQRAEHRQDASGDEELSAEAMRAEPDVVVGECPWRADSDEEVAPYFAEVVAEDGEEGAEEDGNEARKSDVRSEE